MTTANLCHGRAVARLLPADAIPYLLCRTGQTDI
jgi:hypothetical protein